MLKLAKSNEVEKSEQNYIYSAKEIWELFNSSSRTLDNFVADFLNSIGCVQKRDYLEEHASRSGGNKYTEKTLKAFQSWLLRNQANQGRSSQVVKQATTQAVEKDLVMTEVIKSGNVDAFNQLMNQYKLAFDTAQENKRLLEQTKQMKAITNNIFDVPEKLEPVETATILGKEFVIYGNVQGPWFLFETGSKEWFVLTKDKLLNEIVNKYQFVEAN